MLLNFLIVISLGVSAFAQTDGFVDLSVNQRTFSIPGPNCFATALRVTGLYPTFRGVGEKEFSQFLKLNCKIVESPQKGDIGVYDVEGFANIHAFVYIDKETGIDKPGVDYVGPTAVLIKNLAAIDYVHRASTECRRYAKDISECSNRLQYYRCESRTIAQNEYDQRVARFELRLGYLVETPMSFATLQMQYLELKEDLEVLSIDTTKLNSDAASAVKIEYYRQLIFSFRQQLEFVALYFEAQQSSKSTANGLIY